MKKFLLLLPIFLFLFCGCYYVRSDQKIVVTDTRYKPNAVWDRKPLEPGELVFRAIIEVNDDDCAFTGGDDLAALLFLGIEFAHDETSHASSIHALECSGGTAGGIVGENAFVKGMVNLRGRKDGVSYAGIWKITVPSEHEGVEPKTWQMKRTYIITKEAVYVQKGETDPPTGHGILESGCCGGEAELAPDPHYLENVMCGWYSDDGQFHQLPVKDISEMPADAEPQADKNTEEGR